jgi:magnesium-transporting ATPase (P-type)/predicted PurR-regulated permease PerM
VVKGYFKQLPGIIDESIRADSGSVVQPMNDLAASWHSLPVEQVFGELNSSPDGLSASEAETRLREHGPNRIERGPRRSWLRILLHQLADPLVYVLLAAALLAVLMGKVTDGVVVLAVVVLNTLVGFVQEMRAGQAIEALSRMVPQNATVLRDGDQTAVPAHELVPGDILILQPGDQVSADVRLFEANGLLVEEAALTGESVPVAKHEAPVERDAVLGDRRSMAFGGTLVVSGTAKGVVTATGPRSELGRISRLLSETAELETPLTRRLASLARAIMLGILVVAGLIFLVGMMREYPLLDSAFAAITLAVASIPEGLPAVITIASAIGVRRMARRHAIIRHLPAVETLGSTTVICTDKTGTLTRNEMTVEALWTPAGPIEVTGIGYAPEGELRAGDESVDPLPDAVRHLLISSVLCNDATLELDDGRWTIVGDPTEGALVVAARKAKLDETALRTTFPREDAIPFDSERQFMATLHVGSDNRALVCLKGAPEVVAKLCPAFAGGQPMTLDLVHEAAHALAARGLRVLGVASAMLDEPIASLEGTAWQRDLRFLGLVGMVDPPRAEAVEAVRTCGRAGVAVKIVTGDHPATARAIGEIFGLLDPGGSGPGVITGHQIETASDRELAALAQTANVFARVAPEHKLRLVKALQADGEIVAMTGDGVNDAPALKRAEIGVAMGISGTAVAKEAADMVLADDNFASIGAAVEEGRRVYDNLTKSLAFILPTSLGQAMIILVAVLFFPVTEGRLLMPIEPVQILWVNLVVAIALALPLAFETHEPDVMERPPRPPNEALLSPFLIFRTFLVGALMTAGAVSLFFHEYNTDLREGVAAELARAESQTVAVTTIILFQAIYLLNCRSLTESVFRIGLLSNPYVYFGIAATIMLQLGFIYLPPFNQLFHSHPLDATDWIAPVAVALAGFLAISMEKWLWRQRWNADLTGRHDTDLSPDRGTLHMTPSEPATLPVLPSPEADRFWSQRGLSDLALLALTVLALFLCYLIARPFVSSLAWATALAVVGGPLHRQVTKWIRSPSLAAGCSVVAIAVLLIVPAGMLVPGFINEAVKGFTLIRAQIESNAWDDAIERHEWIGPAWEWVKERVDLSDLVQQAGALLTAAGSFAVKTSFLGVIELALVFFFLFYFLRDRDSLLGGIRSLLPLASAEMDRIIGVAADTIFATVYGKVLVSIVQGLLGGLMFWWLDLPAAWFWAIVMGVFAIIPLLGAPVVWLPAAGLLLLDGQWSQAAILALWGAVVVGLADNLLYPIVVGKYLHLHTVPLVIALIGGIIVFGAAGFFVGPVVVAITFGALDVWRLRAAASKTSPGRQA